MKPTNFTSLVFLFSLAVSIDLVAQETSPVVPGDRVRVTVLKNKIVGTVVTFEADTLVMNVKNRAEPTAVPLASVKRLEVGRGKESNVRRNALIGLVVGAVSGAIGTCLGEEGGDVSTAPNNCILLSVLIGGGLGAGVGAALGAVKVEQWEEVPLERIRVGVSPHGDGGLTFTASFTF